MPAPNLVKPKLALKLEPLIAAKAKENVRASQNNESAAAFQKSDKQLHTDKELAKISGLSHDTIHKAKIILAKAMPDSDLNQGTADRGCDARRRKKLERGRI